MKLLLIVFSVYCLLVTSASRSKIAENSEDVAELMTEDETVDNDENAMDCGEETADNCDSNNDEETVEDEAAVEEVKVDTAEQIAADLKKGRTCRLKTEGEKLSKIIRKTGKSKQKMMENEIVEPKEKMQTAEKTGKVKRDTRTQKKDQTVNDNQQKKINKKPKSSVDSKTNKNKKNMDGKKKGSKNQQKQSSTKNNRNKKSSKNEL